MKALQSILIAAACISLSACSESDPSEPLSPRELDKLVDEIWIDLNEWKPVPLKQWLAKSPSNTVDFLTREQAASLAELVLQKHGVEMAALADDSMPDWTQILIGNIKKIKDRSSLEETLIAATRGHKIQVEYGTKWVVLSTMDDEE